MSLYAQLCDVEAWSGAPIPLDRAHDVQALITEAEVELAALYGDLGARVTSGLTTADRLKTAVVSMVVRAINEHKAKVEAGMSDCTLVACLEVTKRERILLGVTGSAYSVSLSDADIALRRPLRRPPIFRRSGGWRGEYSYGDYFDEWPGEWLWP